jgi:hypothetical protein
MALLELKRRGSTFLFVVVVVGHIVLISAQVTSKSGLPLLQEVTFGLVAQIQRAGAVVSDGLVSGWHGYVDLRGVRAQNAQLQRDLDAAKVRLQQERAAAARSEELAQLLDLKSRSNFASAAGRTVSTAASMNEMGVTGWTSRRIFPDVMRLMSRRSSMSSRPSMSWASRPTTRSATASSASCGSTSSART